MNENKSCSLDDTLLYLSIVNACMDAKRKITVCSMCAQKIGLHKCSRCPKDSKTRYCSRECQLAAWPSHKTSCGGGRGKSSCK